MKGSATRATAVLHPEDEHTRITGVISEAPHPPGRAGGDKILFSVGDPGNCPLCVTSLRFEVFDTVSCWAQHCVCVNSET